MVRTGVGKSTCRVVVVGAEMFNFEKGEYPYERSITKSLQKNKELKV